MISYSYHGITITSSFRDFAIIRSIYSNRGKWWAIVLLTVILEYIFSETNLLILCSIFSIWLHRTKLVAENTNWCMNIKQNRASLVKNNIEYISIIHTRWMFKHNRRVLHRLCVFYQLTTWEAKHIKLGCYWHLFDQLPAKQGLTTTQWYISVRPWDLLKYHKCKEKFIISRDHSNKK